MLPLTKQPGSRHPPLSSKGNSLPQGVREHRRQALHRGVNPAGNHPLRLLQGLRTISPMGSWLHSIVTPGASAADAELPSGWPPRGLPFHLRLQAAEPFSMAEGVTALWGGGFSLTSPEFSLLLKSRLKTTEGAWHWVNRVGRSTSALSILLSINHPGGRHGMCHTHASHFTSPLPLLS